MKFLIIYFLAVIVIGISQKVLPSYPLVSPMPDFNLTSFLGRWYTHAKIPNEYEPFAECTIVDTNSTKNGLEITMSSLNHRSGFVDQWGSIGNPVAKGKGFPSQFDMRFRPFARQRDSVLTILDTDYKNFAVLELIQINEDARILQYAWILSRSRTIVRSYLNIAIDVLQKNNININYLELVKHEKCPSPNHFLPYNFDK